MTETFNSYLGMLKHTDSQALIDKLYQDMVLMKGERKIAEGEETKEFVPMLPQEDWYLCYELFGVHGDVFYEEPMRALP